MCRVEERVYIAEDGSSRTFEESFPCEKARNRRLCGNVSRKIIRYHSQAPADIGQYVSHNPKDFPRLAAPGSANVAAKRSPREKQSIVEPELAQSSRKSQTSAEPKIIIEFGKTKRNKAYSVKNKSASSNDYSTGSTYFSSVTTDAPSLYEDSDADFRRYRSRKAASKHTEMINPSSAGAARPTPPLQSRGFIESGRQYRNIRDMANTWALEQEISKREHEIALLEDQRQMARERYMAEQRENDERAAALRAQQEQPGYWARSNFFLSPSEKATMEGNYTITASQAHKLQSDYESVNRHPGKRITNDSELSETASNTSRRVSEKSSAGEEKGLGQSPISAPSMGEAEYNESLSSMSLIESLDTESTVTELNDGVPHGGAASVITADDSVVFGHSDKVPPTRRKVTVTDLQQNNPTQLSLEGDNMEDNRGFTFITANNPAGFKTKKIMTAVRRKAMGSYLESTYEKRPRASSKNQDRFSYQESYDDTEETITNEEALKISRVGSHRRAATSDVKATGGKAATSEPPVQKEKLGISSHLDKAQKYAPNVTTAMEALSILERKPITKRPDELALKRYLQIPESGDNAGGEEEILVRSSISAQSMRSEEEDKISVSSVSLTEYLDTRSTHSEQRKDDIEHDSNLTSGATQSESKPFARVPPLPIAENLASEEDEFGGVPLDDNSILQPEVPSRKEWSSKSYRSGTSATTSIGSDTDDTDILDMLEETKGTLKARKSSRKPDVNYSIQLSSLEEESDDGLVEERLEGQYTVDPEAVGVLHQQRESSDVIVYEPHMMDDKVDLSIDNWKDTRTLLPEDWKWDVDFHTTNSNCGVDRGCWTYTPTNTEPKNFPLSIAGAPVVIPVDYRWPPVAGLNPPPDPRPSNPIDSSTEIPLDVVRDVFLTFEGSVGFYLLVNGILQVIVPSEFDTAWASSHLPHKYGGLRVSYITQSMDPTMLPSKTETMRSRDSQSAESSQISSVSSLLSQFRPSTTSLSYPLGLNDFIEARTKSSQRKERFAGRIGLRVSKEVDEYIVMPTHVITEAILAKSSRSSLFGRKKAPDEQLEGDWNDQVELWAGNERIGSIEKPFDPEAQIYPEGFRHDVTLIKPINPASVRAIQSPVPNIGWLSRDSWSGLRQQPSGLKLLGETESHRKAKSLKTSRPAELLIVGEGIFLNQSASPKPTRDHDMSVWRDLVSRCILYRVYPDFDPPTGYSGTALYADGMREDGTTGPGVVGFQSFVQRSGHVQSFEMEGSALEKRLKLGRVAFYGAFQTPEELRRDFRIV